MTADGFLNQKQRHPAAMTAAIALNLAALTAVLLAKAEYIPKLPTSLITENIPLPKEPPPRPIEQKRVPDAKRETVFVAPKTYADDRPQDTLVIDSQQPRTIDLPGDPEPYVAPKPPEAKAPVMVDAAPDPRFMADFQPPYPPQLLRTGVEGRAVLKVLVGADGRVKQVTIVSADDPLFGAAAERQALRKWRFRPATRDGAPTDSWKQLTVRFEIKS